MFGLFGPAGIDALPEPLRQEIHDRLGDADFTLLKLLGQKHGFFRRPYFRQKQADYVNQGFQVGLLAALLANFGDRLAANENPGEARDFYGFALRLDPDSVSARFGLAKLAAVKGQIKRAAEHARRALFTMRVRGAPPGMGTLELKVMLAKYLAEERLHDVLGGRQLDRAYEIIRGAELTTDTNAEFGRIGLDIADGDSQRALTEYQQLFGSILFEAAATIGGAYAGLVRGSGPASTATVAANEHLSQALELLGCVRALFPENIDAWILSADLIGLAVIAGLVSGNEAGDSARTALGLLERLEQGDTKVYTKNPELQGGDLGKMRKHLEDTMLLASLGGTGPAPD